VGEGGEGNRRQGRLVQSAHLQTGGVVQVAPVASPGRQLAGLPIGQEMLQDGHGPTTGAVQDEPFADGFCARVLFVPQEAIIAASSNSTTSLSATFMSAFPPKERCKGYRIGGT
jgi:hypothetical protein